MGTHCPVDHRIAELAASQFGVVQRGQLRALGVTDAAIARRVRVGRLHRVRRGVYAVGHPVLGAHGRWLAAVLACGPDAVLSHASAAALWDLRASDAVSIDVTVRGPSRRRGLHLRVHRARSLGENETATESGIRVTSPARTILDLAAMLRNDRALERVLDRAEVLRVTDVKTLVAIADAHTGHRGASRLRRILADHTPGSTLTRSELEERMLALCRERGLPQPRVNDSVAGLEVDFLFAERRVVVEADSWQHHHSRAAFERDRERDATLALAGHRVLRFTDRQMARDATTVAAAIRAALAADARAPPESSANRVDAAPLMRRRLSLEIPTARCRDRPPGEAAARDSGPPVRGAGRPEARP
jgi:very-short-patch-repair endonuclease